MTDLLTVNAVAKELGVRHAAVRTWIAAGELEAVRLGRHERARIRVPRQALERFLRPTTTLTRKAA